MCYVREIRIPAAQWLASAPPHMAATAPDDWMTVRAQACHGRLLAAPLGTPDPSSHPAWIDLGPLDDQPVSSRPMSGLVWAAWLEQVGWG